MTNDITSTRPIIKAASACVWRGDEVLIVQRGETWGYGFWSLPGGKIESNETAIAAASRELLEETGVVANLQHQVGDFELDGVDVQYTIACFTGTYLSGVATAMTDAKSVAWVDWWRIGEYRMAVNNADAIHIAHKLIRL